MGLARPVSRFGTLVVAFIATALRSKDIKRVAVCPVLSNSNRPHTGHWLFWILSGRHLTDSTINRVSKLY